MEMRLYRQQDRDACLAIVNGGAAFESFLDRPGEHFYVLDHDGAIAGCGGFRLNAEQTAATLEWGAVAEPLRRKGIGRYLLMARLKEISRFPNVAFVSATVPNEYGEFFARQGFRLDQSGAWIKKLAVCA